MVVLLLVVVWLVALVPVALRKLSEWQVTSSVARFRYRSRVMGRTFPLVPYSAEVPVAPTPARARAIDPEDAARLRRERRARSARLVVRRRKTLARLCGAFVVTFLLGAVPVLRVLWDLSLVVFLLATGYLALLVWFQRIAVAEAASLERAAKVVPIYASTRRRVRTAGPWSTMRPDVARPASTLPPARPAFVLVDVRA